ncbi:hypothetical protein V3C99_005926, partial [Haemonchus contortus]
HEVRVNECTAVIRGLTFDCDYSVEIVEVTNPKRILTSSFSTQPCSSTPSNGVIPCLSLATPVFCIVHNSVSCQWVRDRGPNADTVIGYRVALSSPMRDDTNITILPPQIREIHYENLVASTMYTVEVQPITNRGLGKALTTNFLTHARLLDENVIERFPGGEIIELPLESSASSMLALSTLLTILYIIL